MTLIQWECYKVEDRFTGWILLRPFCTKSCRTQFVLQLQLIALNLKSPAKVGDIIKIQAKITRAFQSSIEVFVEVWPKKVLTKKEYLISEAYFTFVAMDDNLNLTPVMHITPKSDKQKAEFIAVEGREKARLSN